MFKLAERYPRIWTALDKLSIVVIASLLFWVASALVITLPSAIVGLFAAVGPLVHGAEGETFGRFWRGIKRSFGTALMLGLLTLIAAAVVALDIRYLWLRGGLPMQVIALVLGSVGLLVAMVNVIAWPLLAWYPQPLGKLLRRSFLLAAAHPGPTLGGLASAGAVLFLMLTVLQGRAVGLVPLFGPGTIALILSLAAWHVMKRYARPEDEIA